MRYTLPALPGLTELSVLYLPVDWAKQAPGWERLSHLGLFGQATQRIALIRGLPALTHLVVGTRAGFSMPRDLVHPGVTRLAFFTQSPALNLTNLPSAFPNLIELVFRGPVGSPPHTDLTCLAPMTRLRVRLIGFNRDERLVDGIDALPKSRLHWR